MRKFKKLELTVISFGADGDSRELKSMQVSANLLYSSSNPMALFSPSRIADSVHSYTVAAMVCS